MKFNSRVLRKVFLGLFFVLFVFTLTLLFLYWRERTRVKEDLGPIKPLVEYIKEEEDDGFDLLLLGYGGAGHSGGGLSDAIINVHVDREDRKIYAIHIPRDLWVEIPYRSDKSLEAKINMAFAIGNDDRNYQNKQTHFQGEHGGGELAKAVVGELLGLRIDRYAAVDFGSYVSAIDALGGITVNVPVSFTDPYYPIRGEENNVCGKTQGEIFELKNKYGHSGFELERQFECRFENLSFTAGETKMDGETALKFVRSRHSNEHGGDFARGQRQIAVLKAIRDKLLSLGGISKIDEFYEELSGFVGSDMDFSFVRSIASEMKEAIDYEVEYLRISEEELLDNAVSNDGQYILVPKPGVNIENYIKEQID